MPPAADPTALAGPVGGPPTVAAGAWRRLRHDLRRTSYVIARNRNARRLGQLRRGEAEPPYSLEPFERTRSIFVHVPKASGVSVSQALYGGLGAGHMAISEYQLAFSASDFYRYFKFAIVRNPWDRLFSAYRFLKVGGMRKLDRAWAAEHLAGYPDFESFVIGGLRQPAILSHMHFTPQSTFLTSFEGDRIPLDFIGFYENLGADFRRIATRLKSGATLEHHNRTETEQADYRNAFTPAMIDRVAETYRADIERFGYDFAGDAVPGQLRARDAGMLLGR